MRGVGIDGSFSQSAATAVPFDGTKRSGIGRELGRSGRDQFASIKSYGILLPPSPDAGPPRESLPMSHP
jgi:acyl-CoA reductase-like NAD-dependent aldehyde dehydrogenase